MSEQHDDGSAVTADGDDPLTQREHHATTRGRAEPTTAAILTSYVRRELRTAVVTVSNVILTFVLVLVLLGVALMGGGYETGYLAVTIDLLGPLQLLVPLVAVVFGYDAIFSDKQRGELDVMRTYPVSSWHVVLGTYVGRAIGLVTALTVPLILLVVPVAATQTPRLPGYASHTGSDSPALYLRLVVLAVVFALVVLALVVAVSALVSTTRAAVAGAGLVLVLLVFGIDIGLAYGFALGFIGDSSLASMLALSPLSAFRGLVLETAVVATTGTGPQTATPVASAVGLVVWGVGSLVAATVMLDQS